MNSARKKIDELKAERRVAKKNLKTFNANLDAEQAIIEDVEGVQALFQSAVKLMYANLSSKLGDIITEGLVLVFPDSQYKFIVEFVERRNNVEADLFLEDADGERFHPLDAVGGGITDFVALLLRVTYILLSKYDNALVADEPLKFIDRDRIPDAAKFVHKVCADFDFQLVCVTHIPEIVAEADRVYKVTKTKGISEVKKI